MKIKPIPRKNLSLYDFKLKHETYFDKGNKKFFNDIHYSIRQKTIEGLTYYFLVTYTTGFSDMFTGIKRYFYTVKPIDFENIGDMIEINGNCEIREKDNIKLYINHYFENLEG